MRVQGRAEIGDDNIGIFSQVSDSARSKYMKEMMKTRRMHHQKGEMSMKNAICAMRSKNIRSNSYSHDTKTTKANCPRKKVYYKRAITVRSNESDRGTRQTGGDRKDRGIEEGRGQN